MLVFFLAFGCANEWQALDADGDGWTVGAGDCWDETALHGELEGSEIHPEAPDVAYDGVDADCAGDDDFDHDGDGYVTSVWADPVTEGIPSTLPGGDCWDDRDEIEQEFGALPGFPQLAAADVHPGADETWYDGIDANCDGGDDFDQDADGHASAFHRDGASALGDDCFDAAGDAFENPKALTPAEVHPGAFDECYDATDADCDGKSDLDCDHDGFLVDADCDDKNDDVRPDAIETWYDEIDQDCDGNDADQDEDGYLLEGYAGLVRAPGIEEGDCWDAPELGRKSKNDLPQLFGADVHPFATDVWYDGIDANCDGLDDFDQDLDGYDVAGMDGSTGDDCVDTDAAIHPDQNETCATSVDDNCVEGNNDPGADECHSYFDDEDGDGHGAIGIPAQCRCGFSPWDATVADDCNDAVDTINPDATEIVDNATDENCDGNELCYVDNDGDSFRPDSTPIPSADLDCTDTGEGGVGGTEGDCDDDDATIHPGAVEVCDNGVDEDCDDSSGLCALTGSSVTIDTEADGSIEGEVGSGFGYAIAAGELSGDAKPDVAITAMGATGDGTVYGFFGPLTVIGASSFDIAGTASARFGEALAAGADLDYDGYDDDLAIGSPLGDTSTRGVAFLFFGPLSGSYDSIDADVLSLIGQSNDEQLGVSLATGDWNDDGKDDLAIGAHTADYGAEKGGALWVLEGPIGSSMDLDDAVARWEGVATSDRAARSIASGDVDADGYDDLAVGMPGWGTGDEGGVYVVLGPFSGVTSFASADYEIHGAIGGGAAGTATALVDFEGSGYADLLVGAPAAAVAYLVPHDELSIGDLGSASGVVDGPPGGDAGTAVGSAGDFDNDGRADMFVGAPGTSHLAIFYEPPSGTVDLATADLVLEGAKTDDFGFAARSLGDQSGDDIDDLMVAAPGATSGAGTAWILFGAGM